MKNRLLRWLSVGLLAAATTATTQGQQAQLIALWDFNQGSDGVTIKSHDGQWEGEVVGDAVISDEGRPNGGGQGFDVSEANAGHLVIEAEGDENPMNLASVDDQVSIVVWQKNFSNINSSTFWSVSEDSDRHFQVHIPWSNGTLYFDTMGCCNAPAQRLQEAPGEDHEWVEEWHHYAFVKDGPIKRIYIDGELLTEQEGSEPLSDLVTAIHIGAAADQNQPDAIIDDFAIFKGVLSVDQIQAFVGGAPVGEPPADSDGDGLPDFWEEIWGFDINDPADAGQDPDDDGDTNLAEFEKGTDPLDTTDPELLSISSDCSLTNVTLVFSEKLDEASATDPANYSIEPSLDIVDISVKRDTVTITTSEQEQSSSYTITANNVADLSKNTIPADSNGQIFTCVPVTEGVLAFKAWFDIGGTAVAGLLDDPRYPNSPDLVGPVYSANSRDIFPADNNNNFGAVMEGWVTPAESGDYHFFLRSDDASELWISTDDSPGNLVFQAEETGCCNAFQEVDALQTTFAPLALTAGEKYFIQIIYKEGGGGDFAQVAWREKDDDTPAASLQPIPGQFLSSAEALLVPAEGSFTSQVPAPGARGVLPTTGISVGYRSSTSTWTEANTALAINGVDVDATLVTSGDDATLSFDPEGLYASGETVTVTLTFPNPVGEAATEEWSFTVAEYGGPIYDSVAQRPGLLFGAAGIGADGSGQSGAAGDRAIDFTTSGGSVVVTDYEFLNEPFGNNEISVAFWSKKYDLANSSAVWITSASANNGNRGFQAHVPWSNNQVYFDSTGCCATPGQRLNGPIADFGGYADDTFWTDNWNHFAFVKDGDVKQVYINGELFLEGFDSDPLVADVTGLFIGSDNNLGNQDHATYDDFAIFSSALGSDDLMSIVNGGSPADLTSKGLIAYWDFNEAPASTAGPVALWNFDNGSFDDAIGGFDGTANGTAAIEFIPGRENFGQAILLDGVDQFVEITGGEPDDLAFEGGSMTLSAWFRPDAFDKNWQAIIAKGEGTNWRVHRRSGEGGVAHAGGIGEGPAGADITLGDWHHLVAVTDASGAEFGTRLYIDGEVYTENTGAANLSANGQRVFLGENPDARGRYFTGALDDVALWDRSLSPSEVASLFNGDPIGGAVDNGAGGGGPGPVLPPTPPVIPAGEIGPGSSISINFGADEPDGAGSAVAGAAGILGSAFWNNVETAAGEASGLVASIDGAAALTDVSVSWESNNTWSSTGRGEENNSAPEGDDRNMMTGYLDTNNTSVTTVTVSGIPAGANYNVIVYAKGGVNGRGGEFTIGDQTQEKLDEEAFDGNLTAGRDYLIFSNLSGESFELIGTPTLGGTPRSPINGIEISFSSAPPPTPGGAPGAVDSITSNGDGTVTIEFTGTLESADAVDGPYSAVGGATSPFTVGADSAAKFYIAR